MDTQETDERFAELALRVDRQGDIGMQVLVARSAGYNWKQVCGLFGKSRQRLHDLAEEARSRLGR